MLTDTFLVWSLLACTQRDFIVPLQDLAIKLHYLSLRKTVKLKCDEVAVYSITN